jgi:hypothetical protein
MSPDNTFKIWYFNEYPSIELYPLLTNEIWVWDDVVKNEFLRLKAIHFPHSPLSIETIGREEVDACLESKFNPTGVWVDKIKEASKSRKICVFLAENVENKILNLQNLANESFEWIKKAALTNENWFFVIKSRPLHNHVHFSEYNIVNNLKNVIILQEEFSLSDCLRMPDIRVVAACTSSGLHVAAGVGKIALRMQVATRPIKVRVIDEVSYSAKNSDEFASFFKNLPKVKKENNEFFSQHGKCIENMKKRIFFLLSQK